MFKDILFSVGIFKAYIIKLNMAFNFFPVLFLGIEGVSVLFYYFRSIGYIGYCLAKLCISFDIYLSCYKEWLPPA